MIDFLRAVTSRRSLSTQKTFDNQKALPRLPIPSLEQTAQRYKRSLVPLLTQSDYERASKKVDAFVRGLGPTLQERLYALEKQEAALGVSWLDKLWLDKAYLEYRAPTLINVNWWNQFQDPPGGLDSENAVPGSITPTQLKRAANMVSLMVHEEIPPDVTRSGPFCMHQLKGMFGTSRIAASPRDKVISTWPATAKHITVIYKDQFFSLPVFDAKGAALGQQAIASQLLQLVNQVDQASIDQLQPAVGLMTSEHRDTWAAVRGRLESNPTNANTLKELDDSLFVLCLDDYHSPLDYSISHRNIFHGRNAHNRWFDKALQVIVENNGRAGVNGEHSPVDAIVPFNMFSGMLKEEGSTETAGDQGSSAAVPPTWLKWDIDPETGSALRNAEKHAADLINDCDSLVLHYAGYGSSFMKNSKVSPDGWMQMVFQLAYYRQYGKPCPTYESASTRKFLTGRTETVRSCSAESVAFTKAWEDKDVKMAKKLELRELAIASHLEYMKAATNGLGVDRHLLGLKCQMTPEEAGSEAAAMFQDPSYYGSQNWMLSTSNVSPGDRSWGGFGAVVPEGYGIAYSIDKDKVRMSISSWVSCKDTDSNEFRETIRDVLDEFGEVAEKYLIK
ncbi:acyltransferase ChoActase/COT/CPT [Dichotomocladium elegans]|nr:acyltransferase ChoActase/COT/CPT [Dichotomocladium elegans]